MHLCTPLVGGVVWDSTLASVPGSYCYYPLKTSCFWIQSLCGTPAFSSALFQDWSIIFMWFSSLFTLVAIILSVVILLFIAFIHCAFISRFECFFLFIVFSHLRTQIRWLTSNTASSKDWLTECLKFDFVEFNFT